MTNPGRSLEDQLALQRAYREQTIEQRYALRYRGPVRMEGFWYSEQEPHLPMPVANPEPWPGMDEFFENLVKRERAAKETSYRGSSRCRICQVWNGSVENFLEGWVWPEGFEHYVRDHNVRPSDDFIAWVNTAPVNQVGS